MADKFSVPTLDCPFDDAISPYASQVDRHVVEWACRFDLPRDDDEIARLREARVGRLAARTTPRASVEALEFLADWQMWLFAFDDQYCDESAIGADLARLAEVVTAFMRVLDRAGEPGRRADPFIAALTDLRDRLATVAADTQVFRFNNAVRGYFLAQFWEASHRAADRPAGLAEYQAMRRHSGAVPTCVALIDVADGFDLAAQDFCRADVRAITDMAVNVTCWANDILSYPKEAARSLKVHSLPAVLARERRLPLAGALSAAAALHDQEVARYIEAEGSLRGTASAELRWYLDGLRAWMGGNFHWSLETGRYNVAALQGAVI